MPIVGGQLCLAQPLEERRRIMTGLPQLYVLDAVPGYIAERDAEVVLHALSEEIRSTTQVAAHQVLGLDEQRAVDDGDRPEGRSGG
ncbi:hypothetical protein [Kitasatospora sp. McL0602]|uniref:hypothetical protein n=1 Tax=Kitasatospora sp. McL0602 TaxID=3439530 RepID=UPI003F8986B1